MDSKQTFLIDLAGYAYVNATGQVIENLQKAGFAVSNEKDFQKLILSLEPLEAWNILNIPGLEKLEKSGTWSYIAALMTALGLTAAQIAANETGQTPGIVPTNTTKPKPTEASFFKRYAWELVTAGIVISLLLVFISNSNTSKP